jgi:hypothetical protein
MLNTCSGPHNTALSCEGRGILAIADLVSFNALFDGGAPMLTLEPDSL